MPFLRSPPTPTVKLNGMRAWRSLGRFALILDMTTSLLEKKVEKGGVRFQLARDCLPVMLIERKYVGVHMRYEKPYQTLNRIVVCCSCFKNGYRTHSGLRREKCLFEIDGKKRQLA